MRSPLARKYVGVKRRKKMQDEIEDLWSLADECREWRRATDPPLAPGGNSDWRPPPSYEVAQEFKHLADKLDAIAKRLAARMPT